MFSHVVLGSNDLPKAKSFYDALFGAVGGNPGHDGGDRVSYSHNDGMLVITTPINGEPATYANGGTLGFKLDSAEQVKAWHDAGVANGGKSIEDPPGPRQFGERQLHLAYLRDPDGNKLCGLHMAA